MIATKSKFRILRAHFQPLLQVFAISLFLGIPAQAKSKVALANGELKTYMDCQTSSQAFKRVVLKAQKKNDVLSHFEVILVDEKGKSSSYGSTETLDGRYLDPQTLQSKHIMIIGHSKDTKQSEGVIENATAVSLFQTENSNEDISCLSVQLEAGEKAVEDDTIVKGRQLVNEAKYQKFSGTLHHKNKLIQLTCFSPLVLREGNCGVRLDSKKTVDDSELSSL